MVKNVCAIFEALSDWPTSKQDVVDHNSEKGEKERKREGGGKGEGEEVASCTHSPLSGTDVDKGNAADSTLKHLPVKSDY